MPKLIGRSDEVQVLLDALKSADPQLVAIYGRRRIGKTFLVRETYKAHIRFELTGIFKVPLKEQLYNFHLRLRKKRAKVPLPSSWFEAFDQLGSYIDSLKASSPKVIFIDEFPWLDTRKSNFLPAFENFWNSYATKKRHLVVVICGSAASYMIKNIIKSKGGLHNRISQKINLQPFNLYEVELLLKSRKINLTRYDQLQVYMVLGGVPHYLERINPGESVAQLTDRLCFSRDGFLRTEFNNVFASLFKQYDNHERIVKALAGSRKGLTRSAIQIQTRIRSGGTLSRNLEELEQSGFIEQYLPYRGKRNSLFRLTDEYSTFYIKFIEGTRHSRRGTWLRMQSKQSFKSWAGFAFETICIKHVDQIIEGLKIAGIHSVYGSWTQRSNDAKGAQIDLLIDRDDNVVNLCEMKFSNAPYAITKQYAVDLQNKVNVFADSTNTRKSIFVTFITTYGLKSNKYSRQVVQKELIMDCLFANL